MSVLLATLCLNEMEWLPKLYEQHAYWPNLTKWVFVESADVAYRKANPELVTEEGLSTDGTSDWLKYISKVDDRITYIPFGVSSHTEIAQGKVPARNAYLEIADLIEPDFVFVLDADEFYTTGDQFRINTIMSKSNATSFVFKQRHIWRPSSISSHPLLAQEVVGGYWDVPHCRGLRWYKVMRYTFNHNMPETTRGRSLGKGMARIDHDRDSPQCVHLGFAANMRVAKNRYYIERGEGVLDKRQMYVDCRRAFEAYQPGDKLPHRARVIDYTGPRPQALEEL